MEQQPQAANKGGKNNSLTIIVAVIVALVVGVSVYFITRGDSGKTDGDKKDETSQEEKTFSNPADEDAAYTIKISGKTFSYKSKLEDLEEVDLYVRDSVKDEKAKAGKYMIMFGGGSLVYLLDKFIRELLKLFLEILYGIL